MCGITGLYLHNGLIDGAQLLKAVKTLWHRGPDNIGTFVDGAFGMAHTRLSIIDLTGGDQPLFARDGELALIANGEIYNYIELRRELKKRGYHFLTNSDSEVILHAYTEYRSEFLKHLYGMFAFALYDKPHQQLILARDRLGIKPLFIAQLPHGVAFASELKALLSLDQRRPEVNPAGLIEYLQNQFSSGRTTLIKGIERVLPGEAVCIKKGQISKRWRYWSPLDLKPVSMEFEEAQERFDSLIETVMLEHMRSDVPFGLFLSGGVDSSILLALLTRYTNEAVRTFSVGFGNTHLPDELPLAETLAKQFSSRHTSIRPCPEDIFYALPITVWAADELMRDYANLPTALLAQAAGYELKVVFSGEGGDEVFAGYGRYRSSRLERWFKNLIAPGSGGFRTRGTFRGPWPQRLFNSLLKDEANTTRTPFVEAWQETPVEWTDLQRMQYTDLVTALPDNLLVKLDRMLMGWGVEGRVPFLDHRVVEFGLSLPNQLKVQGKQGKAFLKRWAARFLPEEHLFAHKRGFRVPIGEWLKGDSDKYLKLLRDVLPNHPAIRTWFQPRNVETLIDKYSRSGPRGRMVWALLQFAIWHQLFIEGNGRRPPARQDPLELLSL
jgi:asparagine synthase (glutamine-hydrolysing)